MGILEFFKKKKDIANQEKQLKEVKQGFYREQEFFPKTSLSTPRNEPESWMVLEGKYENNSKVGRWVIKDKSGKEQGYIHYNKYGQKHGLEKSPVGGYTLYHTGQVARTNLELQKEWKGKVRGLKMDKKDEKNLKELLAQGQEMWLEDFSKNFIKEH